MSEARQLGYVVKCTSAIGADYKTHIIQGMSAWSEDGKGQENDSNAD